MKFDYYDYVGFKYAMHCKTEEECKEFYKCMIKYGVQCDLDGSFRAHGASTCYSLKYPGYWGSESYYRNFGYIILEWSDFMDNKFTKDDLKNFDITVKRNGEVEMVNRDLEMLITNDDAWNDLEHVRDDLTNIFGDECDIIKVYRPLKKHHCSFDKRCYENGKLMFLRRGDDLAPGEEELEEMTLSEIFDKLGKKVKIIPEEKE